MSFSTKYKEFVNREAKNNSLNPALIFSIIKAESKFDKNAKSSANAIGLMQIKLSTANYLLSLDNQAQITEGDLFLPETNIALGSKYFAYLLKKFNRIDTAICAYNAGETVVSDWLKNSEYSADGETLLKIPYEETRIYLSRVKHNEKIYNKILA